MKKRLLIVPVMLLVHCAFASDNCYIFERGSESWQTCKEQARDSERAQDKLDAQLRDINNQNAQALTQDTQAELQNAQLQALLILLQRRDK